MNSKAQSVNWEVLNKIIRNHYSDAHKTTKGKLNMWICETCQMPHITIDRDAGVTPFIIGCKVTPGCKGLAKSIMYRVPPGAKLKAAFEWYRPRPDERFDGMLDGLTVLHIENGGLIMREIKND